MLSRSECIIFEITIGKKLALKRVFSPQVFGYKEVLNFTRSLVFWIFRVYWVSKSKCIISSNLRGEGFWGKVLNVVIFVESVVQRWNWRSREAETVGNIRKQPGVIMPKLSTRRFFAKKKLSAQFAIPFFFESATGNSWKQLGLVPLTRQKKSYLKPFKVHFL